MKKTSEMAYFFLFFIFLQTSEMANNRDLVSDASRAAKHMQLHEIQSKLYLILFFQG